MFIVNLTYLQPLEHIDALLEEHIAFLVKYFEKGIFLMAGRKVPREGGIIIAHAASREALNHILSEDPFVQHKAVRVEISEFMPTRFASCLENLKEIL